MAKTIGYSVEFHREGLTTQQSICLTRSHADFMFDSYAREAAKMVAGQGWKPERLYVAMFRVTTTPHRETGIERSKPVRITR